MKSLHLDTTEETVNLAGNEEETITPATEERGAVNEQQEQTNINEQEAQTITNEQHDTSQPIEEEVVETTESPTKTFDENSFVPSSSQGKAKRTGKAGVVSIVNSKENGKRITLSKECWEKINKVSNVQVAFSDTQIAISEELPDNEHYFHVRTYGAKGVIYSKDLVEEITELFALDFSDKVSITLYEVEYVKNGDHTVAIITVDQE